MTHDEQRPGSTPPPGPENRRHRQGALDGANVARLPDADWRLRHRRAAGRALDAIEARAYAAADRGDVDRLADLVAELLAELRSGESRCGRRHAGRCDWYGACTGLNLDIPAREAAGAVHPWRVAA